MARRLKERRNPYRVGNYVSVQLDLSHLFRFTGPHVSLAWFFFHLRVFGAFAVFGLSEDAHGFFLR